MVCIYCGNATQVTNSRLQKRSNSVWRRRSCTACSEVFTSIEQPDMATSVTYRHGSALKGFDRDTLFVSIFDTLKHRKHALSDAQGITRTIIANVLPAATNGVIDRSLLIQEVVQTLQRFDAAAATMYQAYHKPA